MCIGKSSFYRSLANPVSSPSAVHSGTGRSSVGDGESTQPGEKPTVPFGTKDPDVLYLTEAGPPTFTPYDINRVRHLEEGRLGGVAL